MKKGSSILLLLLLICMACEKEEPLQFIPPEIQMPSVENFTVKGAVIKAFIPDEDLKIQERGVVWATNTSPTILDNFIKDEATGPGEFEIEIPNLEAETTYFVRTYAKYEDGIGYSPQSSFSTMSATYDGHIKFHNQQEIDSFGAFGYKHVTGTIDIQFFIENDITSFKSLKDLESAQSLLITGVDGLKTLDGLNNLKSLSSLWLSGNGQLVDLDALSSLTELQKTLHISHNDKLENIEGLKNIPSKIRSISIQQNSILESLAGLENITEVGSGGLEITGNSALTGLTGLDNVVSTGGFLVISENQILESLEGLEELVSTNNIIISDNPNLTNLENFGSLESVGPSFTITSNEKLINFCGLQKFLKTGWSGNFHIESNGFNPSVEEIIRGACTPG